LPYLATIVVLVPISRNPLWIRVNMPSSMGKPFYRRLKIKRRIMTSFQAPRHPIL
jgi:hypothetical protein